MNIFESLENLNISEECFDEIMVLVEEYINEGATRKNYDQIIQDIKSSEALTPQEKTVAIQKAMKAAEKAEYDRARYQANREQLLNQSKNYHRANREQILPKRAAYRQLNRERINNSALTFYHANKDAISARRKAAYQANREAISARRQAAYQAKKQVAEQAKMANEQNPNSEGV